MKHLFSLLGLLVGLTLSLSHAGHAQRPELVLQKGHVEEIDCMAFSPNGRVLASGSEDGTLKLWDIKTRTQLFSLISPTGSETDTSASPIRAVAFSPSGKFLAGGDLNGRVTVWDAFSGVMIRSWVAHRGSVRGLAYSPDGLSIASTSMYEKALKLWQTASGKMIWGAAGEPVRCVAFDPNGKQLVTGGGNGEVIRWDARTGSLDRKLRKVKPSEDKNETVRSVSYAADGSQMAALIYIEPHVGMSFSGTYPNLTVTENDHSPRCLVAIQRTGERTLHELPDLRTDIKDLAFIPGTTTLLLGCYDGHMAGTTTGPSGLVSWNIGPDFKPVSLSVLSNLAIPTTLAVTNDGKYAACASGGRMDFGIQLCDLQSNTKIGWLGDTSALSLKDIQVSASGRWMGALGLGGLVRPDGTVRVWDLRSLELRGNFGISGKQIRHVVFSPDDRFVLLVGEVAALWSLDTGKQLWSISSPAGYSCGSFAANSNMVAIGSAFAAKPNVRFDGHNLTFPEESTEKETTTITVVKTTTGLPVCALSYPMKANRFVMEPVEQKRPLSFDPVFVTSVAFSPDGKRIISSVGDGISGGITLWQIAGGRPLSTFGSGARSWFDSNGRVLELVNGITEWNLGEGVTVAPVKTSALQGGTRDRFHNILLTYSLDKKMLAVAASKGPIVVWERSGNDWVRQMTLSDHVGEVQTLAFDRTNRRLMAGSQNGAVSCWTLNTDRTTDSPNNLALRCIVTPESYIAYTPDGYYAGPPGGIDNVACRVGDRAYPFDQFDLRLNRPDKILGILGGTQPLVASYYRAYQKRLKKLNFTEQMFGNDFHLPEVELDWKALPASLTTKSLTFGVKASDSTYHLDRLNVYINDVPAFGGNGLDLQADNASVVEKQITIKLSNGRNQVQVSALNEKGIESLKETFNVTYNGPASIPDLYVVAIGVSQYQDKRFNLRYAAKDADDLATFWENQKEDYGHIKVLRLLDLKATRDNVLKVKEFLARSQVDDTVIIFLSGHGLLDSNLDYYFATTEINPASPASTALPYEAIENLASNITARQKLLLIDTCHSGEVDKDNASPTISAGVNGASSKNIRTRSFRDLQEVSKNHVGLDNSFELLSRLFVDLRRSSGADVISAASGLEVALEDAKWKNGVFTYSILSGLKTGSADKNRDDKITVSELLDYVVNKVPELTDGKQTPTSRQGNLANDFSLVAKVSALPSFVSQTKSP